ncbi:13278_t:CDS:2 [Ambispora gerdemannii]|uniref:13278_t:CDS:1 n=1 Tax=Ambispora gerdemannii TaxID=144530 RepID=A0A9N9E5K7_9GLOM|nr:13278_t:CDS:2 [Ambispora gerdemannii]
MALQPLPLPNFSGEYDEDIDIFISQLSSYLAGTGINPVGARDQAFGILRECLSGRALEWFDRKILGKRWELHNIFANHDQAETLQSLTTMRILLVIMQ